MSRNNQFVLVVVVLIGAVMWFLKSANDMKKTLTAATVSAGSNGNSRPPVTGTPVVNQVAARAPEQAQSNNGTEAASNGEVLVALQARLATEQQRLEEQRRALTELQAQQAAQVPAAAYGNQMSRNQEQIRDLNEDLQDARQQESRADATAAQSMRAQEVANRQSLAQADEDIRIVEADLQTTMGLISNWPNSMPAGVNPQTRLQQLQGAQADQQARLAQLRGQRADLAAAGGQQSQAVQAWSSQARDELISGQDAIQTQIFSLRDEIQRLQSAQNQSRMSVMSLGSQVTQVQKDIDTQNQQVQSLQQEVQSRQSGVN